MHYVITQNIKEKKMPVLRMSFLQKVRSLSLHLKNIVGFSSCIPKKMKLFIWLNNYAYII